MTVGQVFAIGDIHGCARELESLLAALPLAHGDTVVCVGDYIDRGPDSRGVIDILRDLARRPDLQTVFLKGNHEDMCLAYVGRTGRWAEAWLLNGGAATLKSYGVDARAAGPEVADSMPRPHLEFLEALQPSFRAGDHLVVHAGIRPGRAWEAQDEEDLFWIREEFILAPHGLPETIVFGHTPHRSVLVDLPYKIGIDTGCVYGGALTAIELGERRLYQVRFGERKVRESPLPANQRRRA
jgi:serine/threonine protein phosphatase 1